MTESEILTLLDECIAAAELSLLPRVMLTPLADGDTFFDRKGRFVIFGVPTILQAKDFVDIYLITEHYELPAPCITFMLSEKRTLELARIPRSNGQTDMDRFLRDLIPFTAFLAEHPNAVMDETSRHCFDVQDGILEGYYGDGVDVMVPSGVRGISREAFVENPWLRSVILPEGVAEIEDYAFAGCARLRSVDLPESLRSIGTGVFSNCPKLESVSLPGALKEIAPYTFWKDYSLRTIVIPEGVTTIGDTAFSDCGHLEQVVLPTTVTGIGNLAFADCFSLRNINLPEGLKQIGMEAFLHCRNLHNLHIPENTAIDGGAFNGCHLCQVDFGGRTNFRSILDNNLRLIARRCVICGSELVDVADQPGMRCRGCGRYFSHRDMLDWPSFVIRDAVLTDYIGHGSVIPDGVTKIACRAFDDAVVPGLEIPSSVTGIEQEAFLWCDFALNPSLPSGLKRLEQKVFCGSNIRRINLPKSLEVMEDECLLGCEQLDELEIPGSVKEIGARALCDCISLERLTLNEGLGFIGEQAFMGCCRLEEVRIPASVKFIFPEAFKGCTRLKRVYLSAELAQFDWEDVFEPTTELIVCP